MGADPANGMIVYKATHEDGLSRSVIGHVDGSLNDKGINFLTPGLLSTKCPDMFACPGRHEVGDECGAYSNRCQLCHLRWICPLG